MVSVCFNGIFTVKYTLVSISGGHCYEITYEKSGSLINLKSLFANFKMKPSPQKSNISKFHHFLQAYSRARTQAVTFPLHLQY
jgi:hypothetical protein